MPTTPLRALPPSLFGERALAFTLWTVTALVHAAMIGGLIALAISGVPQLSWHFLTAAPSEVNAGGGIGPPLWNTAYLSIVATVFVAPIGLAAGIWLARIAPRSRWTSMFGFLIDSMAALPSVVIGLFGFIIFVVTLGLGFSRLGAACTLALVNLPFLVRATEESLRRVPADLEAAAYALGATRWQTLRRVTLPTALPGLVSAVVLAIGRVFAESAPLLFTGGVGAGDVSLNPFAAGSTLAVHLWYVQSEGLVPDAARIAAGAAVVLVIVAALFQWIGARVVTSLANGSDGNQP